MKNLQQIASFLSQFWFFVFFVAVAAISLILYFRSRKQILFESWVNMYDSKDTDTGRSVGDLLLFKIGFIKNVHERSTGSLGTWNIYRDVPAFRQSLDENVTLQASAELGKYGPIVTTLSMLLFRLLPMVMRPARLKGSIHKHGSRLQLLASLEYSSASRWKVFHGSLWEVVREQSSEETVPDAVEELAFRIYLDLTREELFKSWESFQAYTRGLASYLSYVDLERKPDYDAAKQGYEEARRLEPQNPAISYSLGVLEYYRWNADANQEAISHFRGALAASQPRLRAYAHSALANALLQQYHRYNDRDPRLLEDAIYYAQKAVAIDSALDMSHRALGFACHQLSEYQAASPDAAVRDKSAENREMAIRNYLQAAELNDKNFAALNNLANLYLEWGKRDTNHARSVKNLHNAIRECERTLAINPHYHFTYDNLGNAYLELKMYDKAAEAYRSAVRYKPDYPEGMNDLAALHMEPAFSGHDVKGGIRRHQEALAFSSGEGQSRKLCAEFGERSKVVPAEELAAALDKDLRDQLISKKCTCVAMQAATAKSTR
jgi:tetratricopeptide (TPR) repeat protein